MLQIDNLVQAAEDIRGRGLDCCHEIVYGPHGGVEGLDVGEDFFPLWELLLAENVDDFDRLDFATIKARRAPDWSVDRPRRHPAPAAS
jgi:hypothetical protein